MSGGFFGGDYLVLFAVSDDARRETIRAMCEESWSGERVAGDAWEICNDLGPQDMEAALLALLAPGDRAVYYYLSESKRIFRVVVQA